MKKTLFLLALAAMALTGSAQHYSVTGKAPQSAKHVYIVNLQSPKKTDSVAVASNGTFKLEGDAQRRPFAFLFVEESEMPVVLDGDINVDLQKGEVSGTEENRLLNLAQQAFKPHYDALRTAKKTASQLLKEGADRNDPRFIEAYKTYQDKVETLAQLTTKVSKEHPHNIFTAHYLANFAQALEDKDLIELAKMNLAAFETDLLKPIKARIEILNKLSPGNPLIDLKMADPNGIVRSLSDFCGKGKYVLVDFWASWCGPCRREMPAMRALYERYNKSKGFDIVGVSLDDDKTKWTTAIKSLNLPWHHMSDLKGWQSDATEAYGISGIPFTVLVDPDGKIVATGLRAEELEHKLQSIYGE